MPDNRELNIVDEEGNIIGKDTRENIHAKGLLHREIHVWFYTSAGEVTFQHRGKNVETYPDLLDATVGGHVEIGFDYENAALQEIREETGIEPKKDRLIFLHMVRSKSFDEVTSRTNNVLRAIYAYRYDGALEDLQIEEGRGMGFEAWPIEKLFHLSPEEAIRIVPGLLEEKKFATFIKIRELIASR